MHWINLSQKMGLLVCFHCLIVNVRVCVSDHQVHTVDSWLVAW